MCEIQTLFPRLADHSAVVVSTEVCKIYTTHSTVPDWQQTVDYTPDPWMDAKLLGTAES